MQRPKADTFLDSSRFILKDEDAEKKVGFVLADSIKRSRELHKEQGGLFAGKLFHIVSDLASTYRCRLICPCRRAA